MAGIQIPCPECGSLLRIRDRSLIGRRGKCPKCEHRFVLEEPDEVELELAEKSPAVGTGARWIPEAESAAPQPMPGVLGGVAIAPQLVAEEGGAARLKELRRRNAQRRNRSLLIVGGMLALLAVGGYFAWPRLMSLTAPRPVPADVTSSDAPLPAGSESGTGESATDPLEDAAFSSPTEGEPISLLFVPAGARFVFNLRPAELWKGSQGEEFRYCLGPLGTWLEARLQEICRREPGAVEEALICLIPGIRGTPPQVAAVVRLREEMKKGEFILEFGGQRQDDFGYPVYVNADHALLIHDLKTFAVGPAEMAAEMAGAVEFANPTGIGIEELLKHTDRKRHFTVVFDPTAARIDEEVLIPENARPLFGLFLDWFGEDVEAIGWSMHLAEDRFYSEFLLRNDNLVRPLKLQQMLESKLESLPAELLGAVEKMNPPEQGKRTVIGRFPAMVQGYSLSTTAEAGDRLVRLVTALPERAAPNLALGALLAWDESTRTDFTKEAPSPKPVKSNVPDKIADRLMLKIDVDFRRTPLEEAFDYIAEEIQTTIEIDGDALKLAGYTKNMTQTFKLEQVPASEAIHTIFTQKDQEKMVIVVDESKKRILVTTRAAAESQGLTIFDVAPAQ